MSAESPIRSQSRSNAVNSTVLPQQVTDPTILDSVAGFINDVVPTSYNVPYDTKDQIQWARFEQLDVDEFNHCTHNFDCDNILPTSILLVLGYTTGIQVWAIPANGEAREILSWRHGSVRVLRILPTPQIISHTSIDLYTTKRPIIALCDNVTPGTDYCSVSFISLKTGEQIKLIKFKNPVLDVVANRRSIVITFLERIAVFDAFTLEDRLTVTTCYLSPGIFPNPVALGTRWLAYAENKLNPSRRSSGGNDGEGVQSYTATVLHAAKSLGRGLRELGETVASSLTGGNAQHKPGLAAANHAGSSGLNDVQQKGVVTIIDIESQNVDNSENQSSIETEAIIAHFTAHTEAIVCLSFDPSGLLLLTADKRGHDFHLFRVHPHPGGPALAAVHHLYVLHRGDTTARVQDMSFSPDSRWVTVSTIRGTTHVFPITPYGGNVGFRTHATPHVVNKMSRFHRSAGLTAEGRSNSPICLFEAPVNSNLPYHNPRLPPYPHPTVVQPLAQIRQPLFIQNSTTQQRPNLGRQRLGSSSDENTQVALRVSSCFAPARAWIEPITQTREPPVIIHKPQIKPVESLFVMSCHGSLVQYDLDPRHVTCVPKERVCDDTSIELIVLAKAQWILQRQANGRDIQLPLSMDHLSLIYKEEPAFKSNKPNHMDDRWLSQVEIVTHAGPHRRLWMGPQFTFKTYNNGTGASLNILEAQSIDVVRSKPVNMPLSAAYPILIEAGSVSSCEPSPKLLGTLQRNFEEAGGAGEIQLREDLADAMLESPGVRDTGGRCVIVSMKHHNSGVAKVVNPLGMVVTIQSDDDDSEIELPEEIIHENCDEALFRPVVASKAVIFAEPTNIQSKFASNVLHIDNPKPNDKNRPGRKAINEKINKNESSQNKKLTRESPPKIITIQPEYVKTAINEIINEKVSKNKNKIIETKETSMENKKYIKKPKQYEEENIIIDTNELPESRVEIIKIKPKKFKSKINEPKEIEIINMEDPKIMFDSNMELPLDFDEVHHEGIKKSDLNQIHAETCQEIIDKAKAIDFQGIDEPNDVELWKSQEQLKLKEEPIRKLKKATKIKPVEIELVDEDESLISWKTPEDEQTKIIKEEPIKIKKNRSKLIVEPEIIEIISDETTIEEPIIIKEAEALKPKKVKNKNVKTKIFSMPDIGNVDMFPSLRSAKIPEAIDFTLPKMEATVEILHEQFYDAPIPCEQLGFADTFFANSELEANVLEDSVITLKTDVFEGAPKPELKKPLKNDRYQGLESKDVISSSEDNEEKQITMKKPRKPKTKLGVRISANKNLEIGNNRLEDKVEVTWSSIASKSNDLIIDLPEIESIENFILDLPKVSSSKQAMEDFIQPEPLTDLLKIDKSSDDEKQGTASSQETTESSDDSSKIPIIMNEEEETQIEITKPLKTSNKSKKSKKKKR